MRSGAERTRLAARGSAQSPAARSLGRTRRGEERALLQGSRGPRILAGCAASAGPTTTEERECASRLTELTEGLPEDESISALREAFGRSKYWRGHPPGEPSVDLVEGRIQVLLDLGMSTEEVSKVISDFPEFLGCEEDLLRKNVDYVQSTFFVKGKALVNTLKRKPQVSLSSLLFFALASDLFLAFSSSQVLGNIVDCEGNCVGDCNRCWVRF